MCSKTSVWMTKTFNYKPLNLIFVIFLAHKVIWVSKTLNQPFGEFMYFRKCYVKEIADIIL